MIVTNKVFSLWTGVYASFSQCNGNMDAFDSDYWVTKQKEKCLEVLAEFKKPVGSSRYFFAKNYPLSMVAGIFLGSKSSLSILDFGGGMGMQYLELLAKIPNAVDSVKFFVVDGEKIIENIPIEMKRYPNLFFYSQLSSVREPIDMIHIGSTLQYIDDWQEVLSLLIDTYNPKYLIFSDLLAGDIPSFVTAQTFYEKRIPIRFFSYSEVLDFFQRRGYKCLFHEKYVAKIFDQEDIFPNFGLPCRYQIDRPMNVLFEKI